MEFLKGWRRRKGGKREFFFEFFSRQDRWSIDVFRFSRFSHSLLLTVLARTAHRSAQAVEHLESLAHVGEKEKSDALRERKEGATMGTGESKRKQKKVDSLARTSSEILSNVGLSKLYFSFFFHWEKERVGRRGPFLR